MKLSVAIICKNEEKLIARALLSVKTADEIVILDTGSTDETECVVASLGLPNVRFLKELYTWKDDFSDARNASLSHCTGDWVLCLDADDFMSETSVSEIRSTLEAAPWSRRTYSCLISDEGNTQYTYVYPKIIRLNAGVKFTGACHEGTNINDMGAPVGRMFLGHSENHNTDPNRVLRILSKELASNPLAPRLNYYAGREHLHSKNYLAAVHHFELCIKHSSHLAERADAYLYLSKLYSHLKRSDDARTACSQALVINANFKEALIFMSKLSFEHNARQWRAMAELATNEGVLFARSLA